MRAVIAAKAFREEVQRLIPGARWDTSESDVLHGSVLILSDGRTGEAIHHLPIGPETTQEAIVEAFTVPVLVYAYLHPAVPRRSWWQAALEFFGR